MRGTRLGRKMDSSPFPPAEANPIEAVVFDIGGVLLQLDYREAFRELFEGADAETHAAMTRLGADPTYDAFERGLVDEETYRRTLAARLGKELAPERFRALWNGIVGEPYSGIPELLVQLKQHCAVFALSNSNDTHIRSVRARFPWLGALDQLFSSHELGLRKPEPAIYEEVLRRIAIPAKRVLFFDDREENLVGAASVGMRTVLVRESPNDILRGLLQHGLGPLSAAL